MDITKLRKNNLIVGRAATAIYLILDTLMEKKEVILPSNICYAAVFPVLYSNNIPIFVDVDTNSGNATFDEILKKITSNTGAIIYPYMYGNVSSDIMCLKDCCKKNNIILIEDCASAMGAKVLEKDVGTFGDYSIFSTGHAKIVDVGNGGILLTDNDITQIAEKYNQLKFYNDDIDTKLTEFSKEYRVLRNLNNIDEMKKFFMQDYRELFLYKITDEVKNRMRSGIEKLEQNNLQRIENYNLFLDNLKNDDKYQILNFEAGSIPWRFTILIDNLDLRKKVIEALLKNNLFVSDWYPCIGKIFTNTNYINAEYMEERILNFSLTDDKNNILKICSMINSIL